jgi:hypothetical protein
MTAVGCAQEANQRSGVEQDAAIMQHRQSLPYTLLPDAGLERLLHLRIDPDVDPVHA